MQAQVPSNQRVRESGAEEDGGSVDGAARHDHGPRHHREDSSLTAGKIQMVVDGWPE